MILDKIYISSTEPIVTNVLWAKPLDGGAFSLYAFLSGKWGLLKLMRDNGTPYPDDDTPGGSADDCYTKEEIDNKLADILGLDAEGIAELKALIEDEDSLTGLLSEIARKANTVLLSDYIGSDDPLPTDCIYKRIVGGSEREFKYLLPKEVRYSGDSYLIFRMPDSTDESFIYIVFKREHRTTTMQYYYNASYNTSTDEVPAWVEDAFGYTRSEVDGLLAGKQDTINDLATIRSGAQAGSTAVQPSDLTPIDNRLDDVEYCLGDYLKDTYVFNWKNHTTTTTEPIYTTGNLYTVDSYSSFQTCKCKLTAGSATISALHLGGLRDVGGKMYFTQTGTVTMYLVLLSKPSITDRLIRIYDALNNTIKIISTYDIPYNSQHICTPITFEVEPGYYLKIDTTSANMEKLIWLGQIDFEIAGVKQIDKDVHANSDAIEVIEQKIPEQASSSNKLVDKNSLASVATSGSYNDLSDKPTIPTVPTNVSAFNNDAGYITDDDMDDVPTANSDNPVKSGGVYGTTPSITNTDAESDLDISDEGGNVLLRLSGGHIKTKNFNSAEPTDLMFLADVSACKYSGNLMHISFDDTNECLTALFSQRPNSIYDITFFDNLRTLHNTYGACFSCYIYVESLANVTNTYANEFQAAKSWLRWNFHTYNNQVYNENTSIKSDYDLGITRLLTMVGNDKDCLDHELRGNMWELSIANAQYVRDNTTHSSYIFFAKDAFSPSSGNYYLSEEQKTFVFNNGFLIDVKNRVLFIQTCARLDDDEKTAASKEYIAENIKWQKSCEVLNHERAFDNTRMSAFLDWAKNTMNFRFGFFDNIYKF